MRPIINGKTTATLMQLMGQAQHIVITCHKTPDGDAMGSSLALCHVLRGMGKNATVVITDQAPKNLRSLPGYRDAIVWSIAPGLAAKAFGRAQLVLCLDYNNIDRLDKMAPLLGACKAPRVLIDHHLAPVLPVDVAISHPEASSTCELVYRTIVGLGLQELITTQAAHNLFAGMMTDTGNFTYSCDDPEIYEIVAQLVRLGIDKRGIYETILNTFSASSLRVQGYALSEKMQLFPNKGAALITLTKSELDHFGYQRGDTEGLVNRPLSIPGIDMVLYLREDPTCIKASFRSVGDIDVSKMAERHFGGGGHKNAAGGEHHGTMDQAVDVFFDLLQELPDLSTSNNNNDENQ